MMGKNYIKSFVKEIQTKEYGSFLSLVINLEELQKLPVDSYGSVRININKRKEVGKNGETHYCVENTYKPKPREKTEVQADDLSF